MLLYLHRVCGRFCAAMAQSGSCNINHLDYKAPNIYHLSFMEKFAISHYRKQHVPEQDLWGVGGLPIPEADIYLIPCFVNYPHLSCARCRDPAGLLGSLRVWALRLTMPDWSFSVTLQGSSPFLLQHPEHWQPGVGSLGGRLEGFLLEKLRDKI